MNTWTILLPGPKLPQFHDFGDGPIICVNAAIRFALRCDFWVCADQLPNRSRMMATGS